MQMQILTVVGWLSEGFLGPVLAAPYAFAVTVVYGNSGQISVPSTKEDIFTATIRYVVYSTIGCYLTEPQCTPSYQRPSPTPKTRAMGRMETPICR